MRKKNTSFSVMKEGKALRNNPSNQIINDFTPKITGNCQIDGNGIAVGHGNFKISTTEDQNAKMKCFSFMFIRLSSEPIIEFGLESNSKKIIQFDYASYLYSIRSEHINPQISFDGIDVAIRMYIDDKTLYIYVNDVKINNSHPINFDLYAFYVEIKNDPNSTTILATPFHHVTQQNNNCCNFLSFFPKLMNHFWCINDKYLYSETDNYVAAARSDKAYSFISDELPRIPGSDLIYFELVLTFINSDSSFRVGFTNHEITKNSTKSHTFDSIPYFHYPQKQLNFGSNICYSISENIISGTVIGFGIQKNNCSDNTKEESTDNKVDENIFLIINGNEYRFTYLPTEDQIRNTNTKKKFNSHKHFYSFLSSSSINFQCMFNFGQHPFKYMQYLVSNYQTCFPPGWSIYSPYFPNKWIRGPPPDRHVLNMFCPPNYSKKSYFGTSYTQKVEKSGCFEITFLELEKGIIEGLPTYKKGDEVVATGFSQLDYEIDKLVGWEKNSFAIHSDDGKIFLSTGHGESLESHDQIRTGTNVLAQVENGSISFSVNDVNIQTSKEIDCEVYPSISFTASPCFIVNFGDTPFFNSTTVTDNSLHETVTTSTTDATDNNNDSDGAGGDAVLNDNLEVHRLNHSKNGQMTVDGISYRVTLFNKSIVMMNTKDLVPFNLEVSDIIESRDRSFRGTVAGALNGRIYCYIEKYDGAFPLVETRPLDVALTYRVLNRENKPCKYPVILYNSFRSVDVSRGSIEDLYPTESGLSFCIGVTNRREFVFRPLADFYNNETVFSLQRMPESIVPRRSKPGLVPLLTNSDSQSRFFLSNENLLDHFVYQDKEIELETSNISNKSNAKKKLKLLDIVKILDDNYEYDNLVKHNNPTDDEPNEPDENNESNTNAITTITTTITNNNTNNTNNDNDDSDDDTTFDINFDRRLYVTNSSHSGSFSNSINNDDIYDDDNNNNNNNNDNFNDDNNIVPKNNDWSRIKNIALVVGKRGKDIVAWDGKELLLVLPTHTKIIQEPFYSFGSHRSFSELKRISTGLCPGGIRYPFAYNGFCGSQFVQKTHKGKKYFQSYGGCKMPPLLYYLTYSLNEKKKKLIHFHRFNKIDYSSLPFEFYEVDEKSEREPDNVKDNSNIITDFVFNGGFLYSPK